MSAVEHANITLRVSKNLLEAARELARLAHIEPKTFLMEVLEAELALRRLQDLERLGAPPWSGPPPGRTALPGKNSDTAQKFDLEPSPFATKLDSTGHSLTAHLLHHRIVDDT